MSAPRQPVARILRQPTLAGDARTPGWPQSSPEPQDEPSRADATAVADDPTSIPAPSPASTEATEGALQALIERRAAELIEAHIREASESAFAQAREEGLKAGYEAGLARGLKEGVDATQAEWAALAVRAQALIDSARAAAEREAQASAELALHLTFAAWRKLFGEAFASRAGVQACIDRALAQTDAQAVISIRVSPADAALFAGTSSAPGLLGPLAPTVAIEADDQVGPGGCIIDTSRGMLDARIETQLAALLGVLKAAYEAHAAPSTRSEHPS